jgi:hypothetical protein
MSAETFRRLAAIGLTIEQIGSVLEIMDEQKAGLVAEAEARKATVRQRVQRWRDRQKDGVTLPKRNGNVTVRLARVEDNSSKKEITGKKEESASASPSAPKRASRLPADWIIPDEWLDEAVAAGLPRQRALSEADRMKNWSLSAKNGAKLDWRAAWRNWFKDKAEQQFVARSQSPPTHAEHVNATLDRIINGKSHEPPTVDASYERGDSRGPEIPLRLVAASPRN